MLKQKQPISRGALGRIQSQAELAHRYDDLHTHAVKLEAKNDKLKDKLKSALADYRETFSQLAQSEDKRTLVQLCLDEKTVVVDALMIELRSQRVELVRQYDAQAAKDAEALANKTVTIKYLNEQLAIARRDAANYAFASKRQLKKRSEAEALIGRIIIKRDRRRKNVRLVSITNTTEETRSIRDAIRKEVERA